MPEIDPVIKTIIAEALGEGPEGMRLVGETIVNRSQQRELTPAEVVQQRRQYTGYEAPGPAAVRAFNDPQVVSAAEAAWRLAQGAGDPTGGANHYFNPSIVQPSWANSMTPTLTHGGHAFYTDRNGFQQRPMIASAPTPAQVTPTTAALRQMTSPVNGNTELQTALDRYATRERNRVTPAIPAWVTSMNERAPTQSGALSADQRAAANRAALQMNQSYVGQDRSGTQLQSGPTAAQTNDAARRAALGMGGNFSYAGNQGTGNLRNDRLPQGQPGLPANYGTFSPNQVNAMGIPVGGGPAAPAPRTAPVPLNRPNFGSNVPMPRPRPNTGMTVPQPMPVNMRPNGAPVPFPRPNFGMGGPGFAPVNAASMAQMQGRGGPVAQANRVNPMSPAWASTGMNQPAPQPPRPAVGTILGMAGNGGLQTQGYGGVNNSITQANFARAQGMQINPNGTMSLMAGGGPDYVNGVVTGGSTNDRNPSAGQAANSPEALAGQQATLEWLRNRGR